MRVLIAGLGYIGLPTAAILASRGIEVIGFDVNQEVIDTINEGRIHIIEPELDMIVHAAVMTGKLRAVNKPVKADVFIIAVPTPFKDKHIPDLSYIESVTRMIAPKLTKGNLVVLESTSPVGTTEMLADLFSHARQDLKFPNNNKEEGENIDVNLAYCPERVLPGKIVREIVENDRIVGGITPICSVKAKEFYEIFVKGQCLLTNSRTAEMCKLTENAYRDVNIAFANELSLISDELDVDVWDVISLANHHPRVNILKPGAGVGGHCIAVDPWFIVDAAPNKSKLIQTARKVNDSKPHYIMEKIKQALNSLEKDYLKINICCLGLSFKADIDDLRESPALEIVVEVSFLELGKIYIVEPNITELPESLINKNATLTNIEEAISNSDLVVLLVDHKEFKVINSDFLKNKLIVDAHGLFKVN